MKKWEVAISYWKPYDINDKFTWPTEYKKYLVCRKDGKIHFEIFNGTGWAYNHTSIIWYADLKSPMND